MVPRKDAIAHASDALEGVEFLPGTTVSPASIFYRVDASGDCWLWIGGRTANGYGRVWDGKRSRPAHTLIYEALVGPVGSGLELDHLCKNPPCVNPDHLEPVTHQENVRRSAVGSAARNRNSLNDYCRSGRHEWVAANIYTYSTGKQQCRPCQSEYKSAWRKRKEASDRRAT